MAPRQVSSDEISVFLDLSSAVLPKLKGVCLSPIWLQSLFRKMIVAVLDLRIAAVSWILSERILYF